MIDSQGQCFSVASTANTSALAVFGVNPGYPFDNQEDSHVIAHGAPAFDYPSFDSTPSF